MSTVENITDMDAEAQKAARKEKIFSRINTISNYLNIVGLGWITPILKIIAGDNPKYQMKELWQGLMVPLIAIAVFIGGWAYLAPQVKTSLGAIPGPMQVIEQTGALWQDHLSEREKASAFYERQDKRNAKYITEGKPERVRHRTYTGKPTYIDQIFTSLQTVFMGFIIGTIIAVPIGIACGLSPVVNSAFNPIIQIFKPVSPLAWLPIVTMIVSAVYVTSDPWFSKAFITSALTVMLCSIWPTIINTALGVASIDKDLMNVSKVLQLDWRTKVFKLVLPSSLPLIFTGLRLSLGVGWMVLIAAEMLAQNPGLGKFVWDEFQNGSSSSLAKIMVAVFTIGIIGFILDRAMMALQTMFTHTANR
ncbi:MAG: ABC transporter permease [Methyloligellaceae bacterium]